MNWQTILLVLLVVFWAAAQYGLAAHALLDLRRRPTVRGNNKVVWVLVILGVPIAGALIYTIYGPTSFIRRGPALAPAQSSPGRNGFQPLLSGPDTQSDDLLPSRETAPYRQESRAGRAADRIHQHTEPVDQLPELPELADLDDETVAPRPEPALRRSASRLARQAQRKIRR